MFLAGKHDHPLEGVPARLTLAVSANFPDPAIIASGGVNYVFGTVDGAGNNIPVSHNAKFDDASGWSEITEAFPPNGSSAFADSGWALPYTSWAPDVVQLAEGGGSFAMYHGSELRSNAGIHCVGLARSEKVDGPYTDDSDQPMICPIDAGGAIDAAGFLDNNGKRYVVYKIDGPAITNGGYCNSPDNPPSTNTSLMLQQVQADGYSTIGGPIVLYNNQGVSDAYNVEAPVIKRSREGVYFLFFSFGCTSDNSYATGYVTSTSGVAGPYGERKVLLKTGDYGQFGPGGMDVARNRNLVVYHSLAQSDDVSVRVVNTARLGLCGREAYLV